MLGAVLSISLALILVLVGLYLECRRRANGHRWHWFRALRGRGRSIQELARRLSLDVDTLQALEPKFKETFIPKKRGGMRRLSVPDASLKKTQRIMLRRLLGKLRAHPAATGFEKGLSIVHNARPHVGQRVVLKMDLVDFFPNTAAKRVEAYFRRVGWNVEAASLLTKLCTHENGLPQGAPTSPRLSNLVNFVFDARMAKFAEKRKATYTRYADDITISFPKDYPRRVRGMIQFVRRVAREYGYTVHMRGKLRISRGHQQQRVTGLVVNEKVQLPRRIRRLLRAVDHHLRTGKRATLTSQQLSGWRALEKMIEQQRDH